MVFGFLYTDQTHGPRIIQKEHEILLVSHLDMEVLVQKWYTLSVQYSVLIVLENMQVLQCIQFTTLTSHFGIYTHWILVAHLQ